MDINHKAAFNASPLRAKFHDATATEWFIAGMNAAMLDMVDSLPAAKDSLVAVANAYRLEGAKLFLSRILNLTEATEARKPTITQNLDHTV